MALLLSVTSLMLAGAAGATLEGSWRNPGGSVVVAVAPCGEAWCGRVHWASEKAVADARRGGTDPLVGSELLSDLVPAGDGRWKGRMFVPDLNRSSHAELRLLGPDTVKVTGCAALGIVCKSQTWTRVD
jgi:uncharacterized protein (DUF2147 family)